MPSVSAKQHNFMEAVKHNPKFAREAGVPQSVGADFVAADAGKPFAPIRAPKVKVKAVRVPKVKVKTVKVKPIRNSPAAKLLGLVQSPHPLLDGGR